VTFEIRYLDDNFEREFEEFLSSASTSLFYHSNKYIELLKSVLYPCEYNCLIALDNQKIIAGMPFFKKNSSIGSVVNSLPFFGSHGSIISVDGVSDEIKIALLDEYDRYCLANRVLSSTIIENFRDPMHHLLETAGYSYREKRYGGITHLIKKEESEILDETIMRKLHSKTRNAIRKILHSPISIKIENTEKTLNELYIIHQENMKEKNGKSKPIEFFNAINKHFEKEKEYNIFTARLADGSLIAALLIFYYKNYVEYFVPVIVKEYRSKQGMSGLIYNAMKVALSKNEEIFWNWGGTWEEQDSLRKFKSKWGSTEFVYNYYTKIYCEAERLEKMSISEIEELFSYFYVIPYRALR
jgi:lipid II:glycine glycyltransferase (peptidoglycan interpeptide bridge formation enzyme)